MTTKKQSKKRKLKEGTKNSRTTKELVKQIEKKVEQDGYCIIKQIHQGNETYHKIWWWMEIELMIGEYDVAVNKVKEIKDINIENRQNLLDIVAGLEGSVSLVPLVKD